MHIFMYLLITDCGNDAEENMKKIVKESLRRPTYKPVH